MPFPGTMQLPLQFQGGLNSKVQEFSLEQPYLQAASNAVYNQYGQLDKRTGFTTISNNILGGGVISSGAAITTFNEELIALDGSFLYSWDDSEEVWVSKGSIFSVINQQYRILNTKIATQSNPDVTTASDTSLYAWEDNRLDPPGAAGIRISVRNNSTGNFVLSDSLVYASSRRPKVITDGITFYLIYAASTSSLFYNTIPVNRPNTVTNQFVPLCFDGFSPNVHQPSIAYDALLYNNANNTNQLMVAYASINGLQLTNGTSFYLLDSNPNILTIGMMEDSNQILWVVYSDATNTYLQAMTIGSFSPTPIFGVATVQALPSATIGVIEGSDKGTCNASLEVTNAPLNNFVNNFVITNTGVVTQQGQIRSVGLASKPFNYQGNIFINTINAANLQATYFTQCLTAPVGSSFAIISKHSPSNGGVYRSNTLLSQCDPMTPGQYLFAGQRKGPFTSYINSQGVNLGVAGYAVDFESLNAFNSVTSNNDLHIVGGVKKVFDGVSCVEDNFHLFPELPDGYACDITLMPGGNLTYNALTVPNQYQYTVVYEWTENNTQVQRSGPGVANTVVTTTTGQGALLTVPTLRLTDKINPRSPIAISIYRTQDSLPIFYKITNDNNPLVNDETVDTLTYFDTLSDVQIAANENLYIGSQLANTGPPACSLISLYQNRLMINSTEDINVLWYSQNKFDQSQYNTLPLDWNTSFVEGVDSRLGNGITAIGLLDAALAIFKETSIFILQGDGPNSLDTSGQFNDAQLLVSDTGCTNQNSLVFITQTPTLPGGLLFKSAKGIYLLGRDQSLYYIGAPVEKYNDLTITSASLLAKSNQVVFTTLEGTCLVYNYFFNAWSTWENLPAIDAAVWQDQLVLLRADGHVMIQDITNTIYQDTFPNGIIEPISLSFTTPWIKLNGLQGYQCVYNCLLLGTLQGPHIMNVGIAFDYNASIVENATWNSNLATRWGSLPIWGSPGMWGDAPFSNYQFQINIRKFRCQSIQLTFNDKVVTTAGVPQYTQGYSLNGLVFEVLALPGPMRVPTSNLIGAKSPYKQGT